MIEAPPVRRIVLGTALRQYRENLGYVLEDAARVLECDRSKISRIETGQRGIRPRELRELLTEYGVGEEAIGVLAAIAQAGRRGGLYQEYSDAIPGAYRDYLALEQAASDVLVYSPQHLPDLLQTPEYARASANPASTGWGNHAGLTLARQKVLRERRTWLTVLIGEGALRQARPGADVMRSQLEALAAAKGNAVIQVLPLGHGMPPAGPATILRFAGLPGLGAVYLPALSGGVCLAGRHDVASYTSAFERLRRAALNPIVSAQFIRAVADGKR